VLGAFWYLFSIEREATCWQNACGNNTTCNSSSLFCDSKAVGDMKGVDSFLNSSCPVQTPNTTLFDFGIFLDALDSGVVESTDFPQKLFYCFWWGLRNLRCAYIGSFFLYAAPVATMILLCVCACS
jgi:cyclic nucleotide gated channel